MLHSWQQDLFVVSAGASFPFRISGSRALLFGKVGLHGAHGGGSEFVVLQV